MHEMSIAIQLVDQVLEVAREHNVVRVEAVEVEVGRMQMVEPEALEAAFTMATEGTELEGAQLRILEQEIEAVCRGCNHGYKPSMDCFVCPECGQASARIVSGNEIILSSVICES
ncbi:MAG: hydrogenase maturation nickel metallochaperone HypA [Planctomycetota bacterium]|jgi:hydrogenase nickel incorporation protein HypA/HybF